MLDSVATFLSGLIGGQQAKVDKAESNEMISPDVYVWTSSSMAGWRRALDRSGSSLLIELTFHSFFI